MVKGTAKHYKLKPSERHLDVYFSKLNAKWDRIDKKYKRQMRTGLLRNGPVESYIDTTLIRNNNKVYSIDSI